MLIDSLQRQLRPGVPFLVEMRRELGMHRGFGSRDRRLYRELIFTWLRYRPWFEQLRRSGERRAVDLLVVLSTEIPELLPLQSELGYPGGFATRSWAEALACLQRLFPRQVFELRSLLPSWFEKHCAALFAEVELLLQMRRPPFWLRAQRGSAAELVRDLSLDGVEAAIAPAIPGAVRVSGHVDLEDHPIVTSGRAEVQDIGSQALLTMAAPSPGTRWLDFCAGAGGKSLQLATMSGAGGTVVAHDVRREALVETKRRAIRAGIKNLAIEPVLPDPGRVVFDGVLVDAPCSASGTWRRHPFLRHQINEATIRRHAREQVQLLGKAAPYVARDGRLVYSTCSLSAWENDQVVDTFLRDHREFRLEPPRYNPGLPGSPSGMVTLMPSALDSDGYFLACMRRAS